MNVLDFNDDDVVLIDPQYTNNPHNLLKFGWLKSAFKRQLSSGFDRWIGDGVEGHVLQANGSGWQKGKFRIRIEFVPDAPEQTNELTPDSSDAV